MAEIRIIACDRCGNDASARTSAHTQPVSRQRVTIHAHHDRTIDLCEDCKKEFFKWLGKSED